MTPPRPSTARGPAGPPDRPDRPPRTAAWTRMAVIQGLQLPSVALGLAAGGAAWWPAGLWASVVCCAGTDSGWRWRNRLLLLQAVAWLVAAGALGSAS